MFKSFHGFNLLEQYHEWKKSHRASKNPLGVRAIKCGIVIALTLLVWFIPASTIGLETINPIEQRVLAIFVFAALMWLFNAFPAWTTSMVVVVLLLFCTSDSSLWFLKTDSATGENYTNLVSYKAILACFADPTIMLFIGGFIIAIAATKSGLDVKLAKALLLPFGTRSEMVLLGFLLVTGLFSMFISNTATAAMMLTFLTPVLRSLPADGKGKIALALAIPIGANIGGIGTPIGTPPNAIALNYLRESAGIDVGFGQWMMVMAPLTILLLFIAWGVLRMLFPFKQKTIKLEIDDSHIKSDWRNWVVYVTFAVTIALWLTDSVTGVNANVVAMLPVGVFAISGVITKKDLEEISWSILWMIAGAFALGVALNKTGLGAHIIEAIPFDQWHPIMIIVGSGLICYVMANFISHTATATLFVPILALAGAGMESLASFGGVSTLLIGVAIGSSVAMILPISTPPNALADATGMIKQKDMVKTGIIMGLFGLVLGYLVLIFSAKYGLL